MHEGMTLRPLVVGDMVDRVFAIYRSRPLMFLAIAAIPYLVLVLVVGALTAANTDLFLALAPVLTGDISPDPAALARLASLLGRLAVYLSLIGIAALAVSLVQSASLIEAMAARYLGQETTIESALGTGLSASGRLFVMGLVALLAFIAMWVALVVVMAATREWWSVIAAVLGGLVASVYLAASWMVSPAVAILEQAGPVAALRRSWTLSTGHRWRILGLILLLGIIQVVLSSLLSAVLLASFATDQVAQLVLQQAVNLLASIAWAPVYWGTFAILYYDLRVRREALDLQLAAEALPRAT